MTNDLVKRLRYEVILERFEGGHVSQMRNPDGPEAADRIEKLEAALRAIIVHCEVPAPPNAEALKMFARKALEGKND